jgi:hypothetical protein
MSSVAIIPSIVASAVATKQQPYDLVHVVIMRVIFMHSSGLERRSEARACRLCPPAPLSRRRVVAVHLT